MNKKIDVYLLYKIMNKEFIDSFSKGNFYFSCCSNWISIAKQNGGKGQGDLYEGVFAKYLKKNSRKPIKNYKKMFGKDLKVESVDGYVLLRRKSSLNIPTICFYSIDNESIMKYCFEKGNSNIKKILNENKEKNEIIIEKFPLGISKKYLLDFDIKSDNIEAVTIQPKNLLEQFRKEKIYFSKVIYIDMHSEFDIFKEEYKKFGFNLTEAIDNHIEIFFKDKNDYSHQCELRAVIKNEHLSNIKKGKLKNIKNLSHINVNENIHVNATGFDLICNTKSTDLYGKVTLKNNNIKN